LSTATGTATDYLDLLARLRAFLTTDAALVAAGQAWTELASNAVPYAWAEIANPANTNQVTFETYLKAPGLSGTEQIYLQIQAFCNVGQDVYNWRLRGAQGYSGGVGFNWFNQPGASPDAFVYLWDQPMNYWFIANGQRVIVVAKVATSYESLYMGKILPDGTPAQYPYPVFIGGTGGNAQPVNALGYDPSASQRRYSDNSGYHAAFFDPACAYLCHVDSAWYTWAHYSQGGRINQTGDNINCIWPYLLGRAGPSGQASNEFGLNWLTTNADGTYPLLPTRLEAVTPQLSLHGTLGGVYGTCGVGNSSESTVTVAGDDYLMMQDTFRNGIANFVALHFV